MVMRWVCAFSAHLSKCAGRTFLECLQEDPKSNCKSKARKLYKKSFFITKCVHIYLSMFHVTLFSQVQFPLTTPNNTTDK